MIRIRLFLSLLLITSAIFQAPIECKSANQIYKSAQRGNYRLPQAFWSYQFSPDASLFQEPNKKIESDNFDDLRARSDRMLYTAFFDREERALLFKRISTLSKSIKDIADFVEVWLFQNYHVKVDVENISLYGSFLYYPDPSDVDLQIVVDSPVQIYEHTELPFSAISDAPEGKDLPEISLQVIDYQTFLSAKDHSDQKSEFTRGEKIAMQQLALGSNWYLSLYGRDLRHNPTKKLDKNIKNNYLFKAFDSLSAAGSRLYKSAYALIPEESEKVRLRKVLSRLLITDFIIHILDQKRETPPILYKQLYQEIEACGSVEGAEWDPIEAKLEKLYFKKMLALLKLAERYGKIDDVGLSDK